MNALSGLLSGLSWGASAPLSRHDTHPHEPRGTAPQLTVWIKGSHCPELWEMLWDAGEKHFGIAHEL